LALFESYLEEGCEIRAKKEAGCGIFAFERVRDFVILISVFRDSDRFLTGCGISNLSETLPTSDLSYPFIFHTKGKI